LSGTTAVQIALNSLDPDNVAVEGTSAGAIALMWTALGTNRSLTAPFVGQSGQFVEDSRPKGAILTGGAVWWPIFASTLSASHFGPCDSSCGSSSTTVSAPDIAHANVSELVAGSARWYGVKPPIRTYLIYDHPSNCTGYVASSCTVDIASGCGLGCAQ